jgi:hypothetical protein
MDERIAREQVSKLEGADLNESIARQLGYEQWRYIPWKERPPLTSQGGIEAWYRSTPRGYEPVPSDDLNFATDFSRVSSLPLPAPAPNCQDDIVVDAGQEGGWTVRLVRQYRFSTTSPWQQKELVVIGEEQTPLPQATAYGRAWLLSHWTWPEANQSQSLSVA